MLHQKPRFRAATTKDLILTGAVKSRSFSEFSRRAGSAQCINSSKTETKASTVEASHNGGIAASRQAQAITGIACELQRCKQLAVELVDLPKFQKILDPQRVMGPRSIAGLN